MVEGIHAPAQVIHGLHQFIEPGQVVEQAAHVIGRFIQGVALAVGHQVAGAIALEHEELGFNAEVEAVAHGGGFGPHSMQHVAAAGCKRLAP